MKNKLLFIVCLLTIALTQAQIVNIPDANFKSKLLEADVTNEIARDLSHNFFKIDANNDGEIQESEAIEVKELRISNSNISSLDGLSFFTNLDILLCNDNTIEELSLEDGLQITFLNTSNNPLTQLNISNNEVLFLLYCQGTMLTEIDLSNNTNLRYFDCAGNLFTTLDLSNNSELVDLNYSNNPLLETVYHKNGDYTTGYGAISTINASDCPSLQYVCTDENKISSYEYLFTLFGMTVNVNSYCSFIPEGNYNEITGTITQDFNGNGCSVYDDVLLINKISIDDGIESGVAFTNNQNQYSFYTGAGSFTVSPVFENPSYFNVSPLEASVNFAEEGGLTEIQDLCITPNGTHNDLEIVLAPRVRAIPGFDAEYLLVYKNKGNQTLSGDVSFIYNEEVLDYISSTETPTIQTTGVLSWNYVDLLPFESRSVAVTLNVNSPMEIPAVNIDDVLNFSATITPVDADDLPEDNTFNLEQVVIGAYDPNDITCLEGDVLEPSCIGKYLHYLINFENTGNAPAENIVVAMNVDTTLYDLNSLELLNSSHASEVRVNGDKIEFIFESIFLEALGKGHLVFKMKSQEALQVGDTVTQHAEIFFDFNFPVITNTASTTFAVLSTPEFLADISLAVFPNPFNEVLTIKTKDVIREVEVYNVQGRIVFSKMINNTETTLNISKQSQGVYFAKITTDKGVEIEKIIKK